MCRVLLRHHHAVAVCRANRENRRGYTGTPLTKRCASFVFVCLPSRDTSQRLCTHTNDGGTADIGVDRPRAFSSTRSRTMGMQTRPNPCADLIQLGSAFP